MLNTLDIVGSGLTANSMWMQTISNNIANMNTTRTPAGTPYERQDVVFEPTQTFGQLMNASANAATNTSMGSSINQPMSQPIGSGVEVAQVTQDPSFKTVYDPTNPDANAQGYVSMPNINLAAEMSDMMMAQNGYDANASLLNTVQQTMQKTEQIGNV